MSQPVRPALAGPSPDRAARVVALADQCVQCGLCLPACPTYRLDQVETESPRGRIALARAWALDIVPATPAGDRHLDQCLGCRRCEAVCPAGVQYGPLLVAARSRQRDRRRPGWRQRCLEAATARTPMLRALFALYRFAFPVLPAALRPLPRPAAPARLEASRSASVAVFIGCVAGPYEDALRVALARLCAAIGVELALPKGQACCGSLHAHAGDTGTADSLATRNRHAFAGAKTVLTLATGCHEAVAAALQGTAETRDALDFIAQHAGRLSFRASGERIALHLPCSQRNVVKSDGATRTLLARIPGLDLVELDAGWGCCGAAGTQMLVDPARAATFRRPLLEQLERSGATRLLSANIGCRLHFANGTPLPVQHPLEFLAGCLDP